MESNSKRKKIVLRLEPEVYKALCTAAKEEGVPKSKFLNKILKSPKEVNTKNYNSVYKKAINFQFYIDNELYQNIFKTSCEKQIPISQIVRSHIQATPTNNLYPVNQFVAESRIINFWKEGRINSVIEEFELNGARTLYECFLVSYSYHNLAEFSKSHMIFHTLQFTSEREEKIIFLFSLLMKLHARAFLNLATISDINELSEFDDFIHHSNNSILRGMYHLVIASIYDDLDYNDLALINLKHAMTHFTNINEVNLMAEIYSKMAKNSTRCLNMELTAKYINNIVSLSQMHSSSSIQNILEYQKILFEYSFDKKFLSITNNTELPNCFLSKLAKYRYDVIRIANMVKGNEEVNKIEFAELKNFTNTFEGQLYYDHIEMFEVLTQSKIGSEDCSRYFDNVHEKSKETGRHNSVISYFKSFADYSSEDSDRVAAARTNLLELSHMAKSLIVARAAQYTLSTRQFGAVR